MPTFFLLMMLGQVAIVVTTVAIFYFVSAKTGSKHSGADAPTETADAKRVADLFGEIGNILAFHGRALLGAKQRADAESEQNEELQRAADLATLRHTNRETNRSLQQRNAELGDLMQQYGGMYRNEQQRLDEYAEKTAELNRVIGASNDPPLHSDQTLLQMVNEMQQENDRLRNTVADCQVQAAELIAQAARSERDARVDVLTRLPNRRAWEERIDSMTPDGESYLALVDIDQFKEINDDHGHPAGDAVLSLLGTLFAELPEFTAYRIGGDEFGLIFSATTPSRAQQIVEQIRGKVQRAKLHFQQHSLSVTVSIGAAATANNVSVETTVVRADQALYTAKKGGRNRVHFSDAGPDDGSPAAQHADAQQYSRNFRVQSPSVELSS